MFRRSVALIVALSLSTLVLVDGRGSAQGAIPRAAIPQPGTIQPNPLRTFVPVTPTRMMDTRSGLGGDTLFNEEIRLLDLTGSGGVPNGLPTSVIMNVTVTDPTQAGYLSVFPADAGQPLASNLNFAPGQTVPNLVVSGVDSQGRVAIYNNGGDADVIVDVLGWNQIGFRPTIPFRLLDTRRRGFTSLREGEVRDIRIAGINGVPLREAEAVVLNVTATEATASTYLTVWPGGGPAPVASNLNVTTGQTVANLVVVSPSAGGTISVLNSAGRTHVVVDVLGWYSTGFTPTTPTRLLDTRLADGAFRPEEDRRLSVVGPGRAPSSPLPGAVALNVTVTDPTRPGFLTVWPSGTSMPLASNLNFVPGQTVPNMVIVGVGADGTVSLANSDGNSHVVVDLLGWFDPSPPPPPLLDTLVIHPPSIDVSSAPGEFAAAIGIIDELEGLAATPLTGVRSRIRFRSPSGFQTVEADILPASRVSGNALNGVYLVHLSVPAGGETGTWGIDSLVLVDQAGHSQDLDASEITAIGWPTTIDVVG